MLLFASLCARGVSAHTTVLERSRGVGRTNLQGRGKRSVHARAPRQFTAHVRLYRPAPIYLSMNHRRTIVGWSETSREIKKNQGFYRCAS